MRPTPPPARLMLGAIVIGLCIASLPGCRAKGRGAADAAPGAAPAPVVLDGRLDEWAPGRAVMADPDYLYFRVGIEGEQATLQAAPETLELWLDADDNAATGAGMAYPPEAARMGVDLVIQFSPRDPAGGPPSRGTAVHALGPQGSVELRPAQIGLAIAPTHAASWYEVRLSRHPEGGPPQVSQVLASGGAARVMFVLVDRAGEVVGWSDPERVATPPARRSRPLSEAAPPPKPQGAIRILSYNVRDGAPMKSPTPFGRVLTALDPDVVLVQEWTDADQTTLEAWFSAVLHERGPWNAHAGAGSVAIVSPYPLEPLGPEDPTPQADSPTGPVRWAGAVVRTPAGDLGAGTLHLKCCGGKDTPEDLLRQAQAEAINLAMIGPLTAEPPRMRIIAGDFNLVGSAAPLERVASALDADGSDLAVARALVVGDPGAVYTWYDARSEFAAGQLDYVLFGDSQAEVVNAFVFDASRLSDAALARLGLERTDTRASDHLPVVVDLRPR